MATGSQNLTTYYAKRIIGDAAAASAEKALLQIGTGVNTDTWILHKTGRATDYGIKYHYDYANSTVGDADQVQFVGKGSVTTWIQLDTGDLYILGNVGIGYNPNTSGNDYKLYVNGTAYFSIGTSDNTSDLGFIIKGNGRYLSFGGAGVQAYDSSSAASTLYLNYNGGQSYIGGSAYAVGKVGIGYNPDTSGNTYKLYVNGTSYFNGNTTHNGIDYFANGTTYYINDSGTANLYGLTVNSSATFKSSVIIKNNKNWPMIVFQGNNNTKDMGYFTITRSNPGDGDLYNASHHEFGVYSYNSSNKARLDYRELYVLPTVTADLTEDKSYNILTTKNTVTTAQGGTGNTAFTATRMIYSESATKLSSADHIYVLNNYKNSSSRNGQTVDVRINGLVLWGATYGNNTDSNNPTTCYPLLSNKPGVFRFGDGGPQIIFNTSATLNAQAGALIYTDNDAAATGASFHFVTTESSNDNGGNLTVTAPKFRARAGLTIGQNSDNTSYNLYVNGTSYFNGNTTHNGIDYFANGTTYYINNSGTANLYGLTTNSTALFKSTLRVQNSATYPQIEFYSNDTTGSYSALMYVLMPTTNDIHRMDRIIFRENSYNSTSGAAITSYYEDYRLPSVNQDRTDSASYDIRTSKSSAYTVDNATKATQDSDGNTIKSTYLKLSGGTMTGELYYNTGTATTNREVYRAYNNSDSSAWWFILRNNTPGTTSAEGFTELLVGNGKNSTTAWNASGKILLYNKNGGGCWMLGKYGAINGTNRDYIEIAYISCTQIAGTLIGGCTGNAATATKATADGSGNTITSYYCTLSTAQNFTGNKTWGSSGAGGRLNGSATNGGCNSILLGDDVWLGDVNTAGIMGMKSTATTCGFYFYNSSGTKTGDLYYDGTYLTTANRFYIRTGSDAGPNSGSGALVIGSSTGTSIGIDDNEIMARSSNAVSTLYINSEGGTVYIGSGGIETVGNIILSAAGKNIYMKYGSTNYLIVSNHNNGNVSLQACGGGLYIGYRNTTLINWIDGKATLNNSGVFSASQVKNAVWNDYAECRIADTIEPGYCVTEQKNGCMTRTTERLMPGCKLISDTYGTLMGETPEAQTPIAVSGRVLVYPYKNKYEYPLGAAVCSAPNGTVDIMTREEVMMYPERIVGTVSEIPEYDVWKAGYEGRQEIQVNGRIWIYVK